MHSYHVQLNNLDHDIQVFADENPKMEYDNDRQNWFLVFNRGNDGVVGHFLHSAVIGWWRA